MFGQSSNIYQGMSFQELHSVSETKKADEFSSCKPSRQNASFNLSGLVTSQASRMILIFFTFSVQIQKYHTWVVSIICIIVMSIIFLEQPSLQFASILFS